MMHLLGPVRHLRHLWLVSFVLGLAGCTSGGCASGCACAGLSPLPDGFERERRVENAASVRLTNSGMAFLEQNLGPIVANVMATGGDGVLSFPVPSSEGSYSVLGFPAVTYTVCPAGPLPDAVPPSCIAEIDLAHASLEFDSEAPHNVRVVGPLPVRIQSLPVDLLWFVVPSITEVALDGSGACPPAAQSFADIDIDVLVSIEIDTDPAHSGYGYSRFRIAQLELDETQLGEAIHFCDPGGEDIDEAILNGLKEQMIPALTASIIGTLASQIEQLLCRAPNPELEPSCPTGTYDVEGVCRYAPDPDAECATMLLGLDGQLDLGTVLASVSPRTQGAFDFLFAAGGHSERPGEPGQHWGDLDPVTAGATLGLYGGTEARPPTSCVVPTAGELPSAIPIPAVMTGNSVAGWPDDLPGPHFGMAVSERFLNFAIEQLYNAGGLCLAIAGEKIPMLNSRLIALGLGAPSMQELGHQRAPQPLLLVVRPEAPPYITVGNGTNVETDPLLRIRAERLGFDFYVWSLDRYVRAMTATADLDLPANIESAADGLHPVVEAVGLANVAVSNTKLVREAPADIAETLQSLVEDMVGSVLGSALPAFDISGPLSGLGLRLVIPPSVEGQGSPGLRRLTEGNDAYLGIFATLEMASTDRSAPVDTSIELVDIDPGLGQCSAECLPQTHSQPDPGPRALLRLGSSGDGPGPVEWQIRVDGRLWRPFSQERELELTGLWLLSEGRHQVQARSRLVGRPDSVDRTPAELTLRIDQRAPTISVEPLRDGRLAIRTADEVSSQEAVLVRWRLGERDGGGTAWQPWSEWLAASMVGALPIPGADSVEVEAVDEEGRVGRVVQPLVHGSASDAGAGWRCALGLPRSRAPNGLMSLLGAAAAAWFAARRRRSRGREAPPATRSRAWRVARATLGLGALCATASSVGCSCEDEQAAPGCRSRGDCVALRPGLVGAYTSAAVAPDGTIWVAGYLEADWVNEYRWGDLVVGRYNGAEVEWTIVDGVPTEPPVDGEYYDVGGFRGGQVEAGDDVGLWTSIALGPSGDPAVAYYDATHRSLRYASMSAGGWTVGEIDRRDFADVGRYAKLLFVGGQPIVSYLFIEQADAGTVRSGVRVASGSAASAADAVWAYEEVISEPATPCRSAYCSGGTECVLETGRCAPILQGCAEPCLDDTVCVEADGGPGCQAIWTSVMLDSYPPAMGLYVAAAPHPAGGIGLAFYDRIRGDLHVADRIAGSWTTRIVDGAADGVDTGDRGIGASLAIDGTGNYHLSYVDGISERLFYLFVQNGTAALTPELVDDGYSVGGQAFADRKHKVGDDSDIVVTTSGDVRISYQDATDGTLRVALGTPVNGGHFWDLRVVAQDGFAGAFSRQVVANSAAMIVNWWRVAAPNAQGNVRVVFTP